VNEAIAARLAGAVLSGVPSTTHALLTRADPLEGARAAGTLLLPRETRTLPLLASATVAHLGLSFGWAAILRAVLPARRRVAWGALGGLAIAALDLGVIGRRFPRIRALPVLPQVADHIAFGVVVGHVTSPKSTQRRRR
jgi:hypothetical protein